MDRSTYRGFEIQHVDSTNLGYRLGEGGRSRPGKGRKEVRFYIYSPDDSERPIKTTASLKQARAYIDEYIGPGETTPNASKPTKSEVSRLVKAYALKNYSVDRGSAAHSATVS